MATTSLCLVIFQYCLNKWEKKFWMKLFWLFVCWLFSVMRFDAWRLNRSYTWTCIAAVFTFSVNYVEYCNIAQYALYCNVSWHNHIVTYVLWCILYHEVLANTSPSFWSTRAGNSSQNKYASQMGQSEHSICQLWPGSDNYMALLLAHSCNLFRFSSLSSCFCGFRAYRG